MWIRASGCGCKWGQVGIGISRCGVGVVVGMGVGGDWCEQMWVTCRCRCGYRCGCRCRYGVGGVWREQLLVQVWLGVFLQRLQVVILRSAVFRRGFSQFFRDFFFMWRCFFLLFQVFGGGDGGDIFGFFRFVGTEVFRVMVLWRRGQFLCFYRYIVSLGDGVCVRQYGGYIYIGLLGREGQFIFERQCIYI